MTQSFETTEPATRYIDAKTRFISLGGDAFSYRELGPRGGTPLVLLNHWGAVLDNFDPAIVDAIAAHHHVIALGYRGIGSSGGLAPLTIADMARDAIAAIGRLGFDKVDLLGFSLGGFVAQDVMRQAPYLVRKLILTGTGPAGGAGIAKVGSVSWPLIVKGIFTARDPKTYLFFTKTAKGRAAAKSFLSRITARKAGRDQGPAPRAFLRQLKAIHAWGAQTAQDLGRITIPVLVANGDDDIMVPTVNSHDMVRRIPNAELVIYPDAGHGGIFQYHSDFTAKALSFLAA